MTEIKNKKSNKLVAVKRDVDPDLLELAETILSQVKSGHIKGLVALINRFGESYDVGASGEMNVGEVLLTFEAWKVEQLVMPRFKVK